jgi:hypothetical protein
LALKEVKSLRFLEAKLFFLAVLGVILLLSGSVISGCLAAAELTQASSTQAPLVPTHTLNPTPTIVWFPPTPTFTPFPTQVVTPTAEMRTSLGQVLFSDNFSSTLNWSLPSTDEGTVAIDNGELSIAIPEDKAYIYAIRLKPQLDNFYIEITASPSLCAGLDEYGLLLRFTSPSNYDRLSLTCDGQVRFDRISAGTASALQAWMISGAFPPGAPGNTRLGVWAVRDELRVFINDIYQFSVRDPVSTSGSFGVYARSTGANSLTVLFSNLVVRQVNR